MYSESVLGPAVVVGTVVCLAALVFFVAAGICWLWVTLHGGKFE
jgi:hypothetical protein